jgi:protein-S-isoprenylcysteine O-methyltransferase Ste14
MHSLELKIPPVVVVIVAAAAMWLVSNLAPGLGYELPYRKAIAIAVASAGVIMAMLGVITFRRAHTTVDPMRPEKASSLVQGGIYRITRNPMYLGMFSVLAGVAVYLSNALAWLFIPLFVLYMNRFQITPEERTLAHLFGAGYEAYRKQVRRWV